MLLNLLPESRRAAMKASLDGWAQGIDLPPGLGVPTAAQLDKACSDVMATRELGQISPRTIRGFLARELRDHQPVVSADGIPPLPFPASR